MREVKITFGSPGTGKTTEMLNRVETFMAMGIPPERIGFVSYTKKAVAEAATRAADKFDMNWKRFQNFRTVHSTAFRATASSRDEMMGVEDWRELGNMLGVSFTGRANIADGLAIGTDSGDYMLQLIGLSAATGEPLRQVWESIDQTLDWFRLKQVADTIEQYKNDLRRVDFDDLLARVSQHRPTVDVDAVIIDEAQDLSNAQWEVAKTVFRNAKYIDIAGDDDQAIYAWSGANVERFLAVQGDKRILEHSYRLPVSVYNLAERIIKQVGHRQSKQWTPRDEAGEVHYITEAMQANIDNGEDWLLLARNGCFLEAYEDTCFLKGVAYTKGGKSVIKPEHVKAIVLYNRQQQGGELTQEEHRYVERVMAGHPLTGAWFDDLIGIPRNKREFYRSILRRGGRLQDPPKVHLSTIHGVKGGEATNVVLSTDMTRKSFDSMQVNADNEHRVFYVGATRARQRLFIIQPQSDRGYIL